MRQSHKAPNAFPLTSKEKYNPAGCWEEIQLEWNPLISDAHLLSTSCPAVNCEITYQVIAKCHKSPNDLQEHEWAIQLRWHMVSVNFINIVNTSNVVFEMCFLNTFAGRFIVTTWFCFIFIQYPYYLGQFHSSLLFIYLSHFFHAIKG